MKKIFLLMIFILGMFQISAQKKPNIIFIAIDDINDWVGPLEGNKQAITPNMDNFIEEAMVFKNAVCAAPICGPSRSAILSGFLPSTSGVYGNSQNMIYSDIVKKNATLPEYFSKNGYYTLANGKIFHKHGAEFGTDFGHWAFDEFARARRYEKDPVNKKRYTASKAGIINGEKKPEYKSKKSKLSWGPTIDSFEETVDYKVADWACNQLKRDFDRPFFMGVGFIKPHLPWIVPQEFFDMYDVNKIIPPIVPEDDLDDILKPNGEKAFQPTGEYKWIKKHGLEKEATRAYLANISYVDACLGVVMEALEESGYADNTIVIIWGDHGWHLGEKQRYLKNTTFLEAVRTPLFIRLPGMKKAEVVDQNVSLIDLYPTLVSLCGLPEKANIDGHDFSTILKNPNSNWDYPGITITSEGTSILKGKWHYMVSLKGTEQLYNIEKDPMEWENLILNKNYKSVLKELKKWVPKKRQIPNKTHFDKQKNYVDAEADPTIKATRNLENLN
ncbi:sulfatase [Lutibacter sp. A80]|uniref:sulfatase n=1 Tax=Lutibacter sp. A80 TaxID=2918453 RepID=UPI001F069707|nr:sulfatase [Lutibacter sp. A80]UMB61725.1 sulfatase [Lutibacter sp. A80]